MGRVRVRVVMVALVAIFGIALIAVSAVPELRWRGKLVVLKVTGEIPSISAVQLLSWMVPGSPVHLEGLAEEPVPRARIQNLNAEDAEYAKSGEQLFQQQCSICHGAAATGGTGPDLIAYVDKSTHWDFFSTTKWGRSGTAMLAQQVTDKQIWQLHAFLRSKGRAWAAEVADNLTSRPQIDVKYASLESADMLSDNWLMYAGDFKGHRFSSLTQINRDNVRNLRVAWAAQLRSTIKPLQATPIVVGGLIFASETPDGVVALDARSGNVVWRFSRPLDLSKLPLCCGASNRGVAVLGSRIFVTTLDSYLIALDAMSGKKIWEVKVAEASDGYSMTTAPLALDGHIVVGVAGGELGIRGFVASFSPDDGRRLWQFDTIPGPGQPGHETWPGDTWKSGGGPTWSVGSFDKERDVIYWTIGNPWPDFQKNARVGDNLYTNSVVALERKTGKMLWYFQFTPNDAHDWDATQQPILVDINWQGQQVPAMLLANRNGFYYVLDRRDGRFLYAKAYVKQTWAKRIDEKGRPERDPASLPTPAGTIVWPWSHGGTNWWPQSFDAKRNVHFVPTVDAAAIYYTYDTKYKPGEMTMGGNTALDRNLPGIMAVKAIDPDTGNVKWSTRLDKGELHQYSRIGGILSTDGNIVVAGYENLVSILDSDTGRVLWTFNPGGPMNSGPVTYALDGKQYIALFAGNVLFAFTLGSAD